MKKLSCYIGLLMATLWLSACKSDTPLEPDTTVGDGEQVLEITVDGDFYASSRSTAASAGYKLVSSQAIQHIEHLYAYIFEGSDASAKCVYVTEIPWEQNSQQGSASLTYRLKEANLPHYGKSDMKVLVVAVDNNTDTYYFPYEGVANHADDTNNQEGNNAIIGKSLNAVKLKLAEAAAETTTSDADKAFKMANTEVFSGLASFKADDQIIKVSLQRCVAGVLCYLTDIPYYVGTGTEDNNKISSIELQLGNSLKLNTEYASFYDGTKFGSAASNNNNVIASVNILEYIYGKGTTSGTLYVQPEDASLTEKNTHRLYVPAMDNGAVKTKENTILFGAYLLPIKNIDTNDNTTNATFDNTTNATLKLVLKANNEVQQTAFIVKNTLTSISGADGTTNEFEYAYSLKANRLYSIGSKPFATDTDADQPASLKGKEILLNVIDWTDGNNNVNFPVYSLKSTISADWETQYENYIFNCMNTKRTVYINLSKEDLNKDIKIQAVGSDGCSLVDWIDFSLLDTQDSKPGSIDISPSTNSRIDVNICLHDYALRNSIIDNTYLTVEEKINKLQTDFRTATLQLYVGNELKYTSSKPIKQYNAITCGDVAFARLDYGDEMGDKGISLGTAVKIQWGFYRIGCWKFFDHVYEDRNESDGEYNSDRAAQINYSGYDGSALCKTRYSTVGLSGKYWFLPSSDELQQFIKKCMSIGYHDIINLSSNTYWTSTPYEGSLYYRSEIVETEYGDISGELRDKKYNCRQAIKFPN